MARKECFYPEIFNKGLITIESTADDISAVRQIVATNKIAGLYFNFLSYF